MLWRLRGPDHVALAQRKVPSELEALRNVFFRLAAFVYSSHKHEPFMQVRHTRYCVFRIPK